MSFYYQQGGRNPDPEYRGQCIMGENGYPLIAARIKSGRSRGDLQWRVAEVECGLAMDGGLQDIVLHAILASKNDTVYVEPAIFDNKDHMGAITKVLEEIPKRNITVKASNAQTPAPEGAVVITLATSEDAANAAFIPASPTKTSMYYKLNKIPYSHWNSRSTSWPSLSARGISR